MDEFELELIDEYTEEEHVTTDVEADWQIERIKAIQAEMRRKEMIAQNKIQQIVDWLEKERKTADNEIAFRQSILRTYFDSLPKDLVKQTKTQKSYKLPSGTLRVKQLPPEFRRDDDTLLQWIKANKPRFVKIKEMPDWAGLKDLVQIVDDKAIDIQTGTVVEGVEVVAREPKFEVDIS